jgi:hypothetical protein
MPHKLYLIFCTSVLGLSLDSWAVTCAEAMFKNLFLHTIDAMMYYFDTNLYHNCKPVSYPGDCKDMAKILACLMLLLVGADACTSSTWSGERTKMPN